MAAKRKARLPRTVQVRFYRLVVERMEQALNFGVNHAYKYTDKPTHDAIVQECLNEIELALNDLFIWPEDGNA